VFIVHGNTESTVPLHRGLIPVSMTETKCKEKAISTSTGDFQTPEEASSPPERKSSSSKHEMLEFLPGGFILD
jgi:hypothetical protein